MFKYVICCFPYEFIRDEHHILQALFVVFQVSVTSFWCPFGSIFLKTSLFIIRPWYSQHFSIAAHLRCQVSCVKIHCHIGALIDSSSVFFCHIFQSENTPQIVKLNFCTCFTLTPPICSLYLSLLLLLTITHFLTINVVLSCLVPSLLSTTISSVYIIVPSNEILTGLPTLRIALLYRLNKSSGMHFLYFHIVN